MAGGITIVDFGMGNIGSLANMLRRHRVEVQISADPRKVLHAQKLILPGGLPFGPAMRFLTGTGLDRVIRQKAQQGTPILGISSGMQLLFEGSEEAPEAGLGLMRGRFRRFPSRLGDRKLELPHLSWNFVGTHGQCQLVTGLGPTARFFFSHSYFLPEVPPGATGVLVAEHGGRFIAGVECQQLFGVQFRPEKSHGWGVRLLGNFVRISQPAAEDAAAAG